MKKRILSLVLIMSMLLSLLPVSANAATTVKVGATELSDGQYTVDGLEAQTGAPQGNSYACLKDGVLTLKDFSYEGAGQGTGEASNPYCAISALSDITLKLIGNNTIAPTSGQGTYRCGLYCAGTLQVTGEDGAVLSVSSSAGQVLSAGINVENDILISENIVLDSSGGTVNRNGTSCGIYCNGTVSIKGSTVIASGTTRAFYKLPALDGYTPIIKAGADEATATEMDLESAYKQKYVSITLPVQPEPDPEPETPEKAETPDAPIVIDKTDTTVTVQAVIGQAYRLNGGEWITAENNALVFDELKAETTYQITTYVPQTDQNLASDESEATQVTTLASAAAAPMVGVTEATENTITLEYHNNCQYSADGVNWSSTNVFSGLSAATEYRFYVRYRAAEHAMPSQISTITAYTAQTAPTIKEGYSIDYLNSALRLEEGYEISLDGSRWLEEAELLPAQTYYVRKAASDPFPASAGTFFTTPARPAAPKTIVINSRTDTAVEFQKEAGMEYRLDDDAWFTPTGNTYTFDGLKAQTIYNISARAAATDASFAGEMLTVPVKTLKSAPDVPVDEITVSMGQIIFPDGYNWELSQNNGVSWIKVDGPINAAPGKSHTLLLRLGETENTAASAAVKVTIHVPFAKPEAGIGYSIDFKNETLAATENYEISTDGTNWKLEADLTPGGSYFVRKAASGLIPASEATSFTVPERPSAPAAPAVVSRTEQSITITALSGMEYRVNDSDWQTLRPGSHTFTGLEAGKTYTLQARLAATESSFASAASEGTIVTTLGAAAAAPEVRAESVHADRITLEYNEAWEYSTDGENWSGTHEFSHLSAATEYTFHVRIRATEDALASQAAEVRVYTAFAAPAVDAACSIDYFEEKITSNEGYEISRDEQEWSGAAAFEAGGVYFVRKAAAGQIPASAAVEFVLASRPAAPACTVGHESILGKADGCLAGITVEMEYCVDGSAWRAGPEELTGLAAGTVVQVRIRATEQTPCGLQSTYTIAAGTALTVRFDGNGAQSPDAITGLTYGQKISEPAAPERSGYRFDGWYAGETKWNFETQGVTDHLTLRAEWSLERYSISYDLAGGTAENPATYTVESAFTLANPSREGYTFAGWTGSDVHSASKTVSIEPGSTGNRSYTATWTPIEYTITLQLAGGSGQDEHTYTIESETFTLTNPTKEGYLFAGWAGEGLDETVMTLIIEKGSIGARIYKANWTPETYAIRYNLGGGIAEDNPVSYTIQTPTFSLNAPFRIGYLFVGWTGSDLHSASKVVEIPQGSMGERTYTAVWTPVEYFITYDLSGGVGAENPGIYNIESGNILLTNPTREGYRFAGWLGTGLAGATLEVTIPSGSSGERSYKATWKPIEYTITYDTVGGKMQSGKVTSYTIESEDFTLAHPIRTGYDFAGWVGTDLLGASKTVLIEQGSMADRVYTATWTPSSYPIYYQLSGGSAFGNPDAYTVESADITLNKPVRAGYTFAGWTGTELLDATQVVTIPTGSLGVRVYTATWEVIGYAIDYDLDGGQVQDNPAIYTTETETFTLVNPVRPGFTFAGWTGTGLTSPAMTVTIPKGSLGDRAYQANWTPVVYAITYDLAGGTLQEGNLTSYTALTESFTLGNPVRDHYRFAGWVGTGLAEPTLQVTVSQGSLGNRAYTATWMPINYPIRYHLHGGSAEGNPTSYTIESEAFTLCTPIRLGYTFAGWTGTDLTEPVMALTVPEGSAGEREYTAHWTANVYCIAYNLSGGEADNPASYTVETEAFVLGSPERDGYTFLGWTGTGLEQVTARVAIPKGTTGDRSYTAHWSVKEYAISYDLAGGTVSGNPAVYTVESETFTLSNPTRRGYSFAGWVGTDLEEPAMQVVIAQGSTADRHYTATWTLDSYAISYDLSGGEAEGNPGFYTVESEELVLSEPVRRGYTFLGWVGTDLQEPAMVVTIPKGSVGSRGYIAVWQLNTYTLTLNYAGGSAENPATYTVQTPTFTLNNPTRPGYTFLGWGQLGASELVMQVRIETGSVGDLRYTADWSADVYAITYDLAGGSAENPASYTVETPSFTLTNPVREGYLFAGWIGTGLEEATQNVTIPAGSAGARCYTATWVTEGYSISYDLAGGSVVGNPAIYTTESEDIILREPVRVGYSFLGWTGTDLTDLVKQVCIPAGSVGNRSYTAVWEREEYAITYQIPGVLTHNNPLHYNVESEQIVLENPMRIGYKFLGWTGTDSPEPVLTLIIPTGSVGNRSYTANWQLEEYEISYDLAGGTAENPGVYSVETDSFTLKNPLRAGYVFAGWTGADLHSASLTVLIEKGSTGERTYTATWMPEEYAITLDLAGGSGPEGRNYTVESETFTLAAPLREGYEFVGWISTGLSEPQKNVTVPQGSMGSRSYTAVWQAVHYRIAYDLSGGMAENFTDYTVESGEITLHNPVREGYTFLGWTGSDLFSPSVHVVIPQGSTGDRNYTANWQAVRYTIRYDLAGGSAENPDSYTVETDSFTLTNPTRAGYVFAGWIGMDSDAAVMTLGIPKGSTGARSYTATWSPEQYHISYHLAGGTAENPVSYTVESESFVLENPVRDGYTFLGWIGTQLHSASLLVEVPQGSMGERTYTATWQATEYPILYRLEGGNGAENPAFYTVESNEITLANPTRLGYEFGGWTGTGLTEPTMQVTIPKGSTGVRVYIATWLAEGFRISYDLRGGEAEGNPVSYNVQTETFVLVNPTRTGYVFTGWIGTDLTRPTMEVTVPLGSTGDRSYTAMWRAEVYPISYDLAGGTAENPDSYTIESDEIVLNNPVRTGYTFLGWTGTGLTEPTLQVTIPADSTGNRHYTAHWQVECYGITYDLAGGTAENPDSCTIESDEIVLNNPVRTGYTFLGWTGTGLTEPTLQVTIPAGSTGNRRYTAHWQAEQYSISYDLAGGAAENPDSYTIESDEIVLNNPIRKGYTFLGWTGTGLTEPTLQVTIPAGSTGNRHYTAHWQVECYSITYDLAGGTAENPAEYTVETESFTLKNPVREGYTFTGWIGTDLSEATLKLTIVKGSVGDRFYTATWTAGQATPYKVEHAIENLLDEGFTLEETEVFFGTTDTQVAPKVKAYSGFMAPAVQQAVIRADGSLVIRYVYLRNSYAVTYRYENAAPDGAPEAPQTANAKFEQSVTLEPVPEVRGYTFSGWSTDDADVADGGFTQPAHDVRFMGTWRANCYAVRFHANGGSGEMEEQGFTFDEAQALCENAFTRGGYTFEGWALSAAGEAVYANLQSVINLTELDGKYIDLYAVWKKTPVITPAEPPVVTPPAPPVIVPPVQQQIFLDVPQTAWYADAVAYVSRRSLMQGVGEGNFNPAATTSRAMLAAILWRLEGQPQSAQANPFRDVAEGTWYTQAVAWAAEQKIVFGTAADAFSPDADLTREQLVCLLWRYVQYKDAAVDRTVALDGFHDAETVSDYALQAMQWAYAMGLISGKGEDRLDPGGDAKRCELASILMRFLETYGY